MKKFLFVALIALLAVGIADAQLKFVPLGEKSARSASTIYTDHVNYATCIDSLAFLMQTTDSLNARVFVVAYPYPSTSLASIAIAGTVVDTISESEGAKVFRYALAVGTNPALLGYYGIGLKIVVDSTDVVPTGVIKTWISGN